MTTPPTPPRPEQVATADLEQLEVLIHQEAGVYWAEIPALPGCFATGDTTEELAEALKEAVVMYLSRGRADGGEG